MSLGQISTNEASTVYSVTATHTGTSATVSLAPIVSSSDPEDRETVIQALVDLFASSGDFTLNSASETLQSFRDITATS